ncbi:ATP-binding cassette domain-containing protein [Anaerocolumna sedimenticola]|uniref:ATP-binding cassette domain-containing protein n=1 Tax=Anaerocolumna sedimenticola TaxID=2696063 RepID=A0A6P1TSW9_9FIRM|nr:oligopeptide/dipeptide ABC transporter ATP-binding protein [Anaerocolumna sedimenticola]QHQ62826.1 ATP-binding cassette domain-containing protein [Anaerocolumna sedimenticola]
MEGKEPLLQIKQLKKHFPIEAGIMKKQVGLVKAVDDVTLTIHKNEVLGVVGESGCGKTTLGRTILRIVEPTSGKVIYHFDDRQINFTALDKKELRFMRRYVQMIFQNPYTSLNPRMTVFDIVAEPMVLAKTFKQSDITDRVRELITKVGLEEKHLNRYPHAFSGGQRQRIGIARALSLQPKFVIADEAVSALDVSIQAQILNLLQDLQEEFGLTYMFIAHNLSVVEHISDRVCVMYLGRVVEIAETEELFYHPLHPYTEALLSAIPVSDPTVKSERIMLPGEIGNAAKLPTGCSFHPRCRYAKECCKKEYPPLKEVGAGHLAACHFAKDLSLSGIKELKLNNKKIR